MMQVDSLKVLRDYLVGTANEFSDEIGTALSTEGQFDPLVDKYVTMRRLGGTGVTRLPTEKTMVQFWIWPGTGPIDKNPSGRGVCLRIEKKLFSVLHNAYGKRTQYGNLISAIVDQPAQDRIDPVTAVPFSSVVYLVHCGNIN